jgi:hypothetical protein
MEEIVHVEFDNGNTLVVHHFQFEIISYFSQEKITRFALNVWYKNTKSLWIALKLSFQARI